MRASRKTWILLVTGIWMASQGLSSAQTPPAGAAAGAAAAPAAVVAPTPMQAKVAGRQLIMVFLDATGKVGRMQDAERVRRWVEVQTDARTTVRPQG